LFKVSWKKYVREIFSKDNLLTLLRILIFGVLILYLLCPTGTDQRTGIEDKVMASHIIYIYIYIEREREKEREREQ